MDPDQCWVAMHSSPGQCFRGFFLAKSRDSLDNVRTLQVRRNNSNICHELVEERWLRKKRCFHYCIHYTLLAWLLSSSSYCKPTWRRCKGISDKLAHFHQLRRCRNCSACRHGCGSSLESTSHWQREHIWTQSVLDYLFSHSQYIDSTIPLIGL